VVTVTEEISRTAEMEPDPVATRGTDTIVGAATAIGTLAEAATATTAAAIEITTETVAIVNGTELATIEIARWIAVAATDPTNLEEASAAMIRRNGALVGVHRKMSNHSSPSMFDRLIHPAFLDPHQMQASHLICQR